MHPLLGDTWVIVSFFTLVNKKLFGVHTLNSRCKNSVVSVFYVNR